MKFEVNEKRCPKCDSIIQTNGEEVDLLGKAVVDAEGHIITRKYAQLICERCARAACPPKPPRKRIKKGVVDKDQLSLCEKPDLKYVGQKYGSGRDE